MTGNDAAERGAGRTREPNLSSKDQRRFVRMPAEGDSLFRRLAETTGAAIIIHQDSRICYVNWATEVLTGYTRDELLGMRFWDFVHPDFQQLVKDRAEARLKGIDVPGRYECKIISKGGEERWVDVTAGALLFNGVQAGMKTAYDITARKRAEEMLTYVASFVEESPNPTIEIDAEGAVTYINPAARQAFPDLTALRPWEHPILKPARTALSSPELQHHHFLLSEIAFNGRTYEERISIQNGRVRIYAPEVTERKRAEEQLRASREELRALYHRLHSAREEERTRIARDVHDKLGHVLAYVKLALSRLAATLPGKQRALAAQIEGIASAIHEAIQAARKVYSELRPSVVQVLELKSSLTWLIRQFRIRTEVPCTLRYRLRSVQLDSRANENAFWVAQEVLDHVAQHTRSDKVGLSVSEVRNRLMLEVSYHRANDTPVASSVSFELLGVRERVRAMGGEMDIQEHPDLKTSIVVRLPARGEQSKSPRAKPLRPATEKNPSRSRPSASRKGMRSQP